MAGVVAGIGTLLFTGVATYYGAMVSRDQLAQTREDAEKKDRGQASRVATWVDYGDDGDSQLHLMNRSPDPISNVAIYFEARVGDWNHTKLLVTYSVNLPSLPPCSDSVFDPDDWMYRTPKSAKAQYYPPSHRAPLHPEDGWKKQPTPDIIQVPDLTFTDREGSTWRRDSGGLSRWKHIDELQTEGADRFGIGGIKRDPQVKPAPSCDDGAR